MRIETSWLDFKVGVRMLVKHPVLTLIGVLATTFAIGASAAYFEIVNDFANPVLPLHDGTRVVTIRNEDIEAATTERQSLHDFGIWRRELKTVQDLGAYIAYSRNLAPADGNRQPVDVVEISAAAFRVARIPPLAGRPLVETDEQEGAPPVAVIGERLWETRFNRDAAVVGQTVELGAERRTVVGVMPHTFALPVSHSLWIPLRTSALQAARREGPAMGTIGRLAPGVTYEQAQAELTLVGTRLAAEFPATHAHLRPRVMPYLKPLSGDPTERAAQLGVNGLFLLLLAVVCGNVGALMFARIATRERELTVRTALGASRRRIVMQLFVEALVLNATGAAVALTLVSTGLHRAENSFWAAEGATPPFWRDPGLNVSTVLYVVGLTLLGAIVTGALPALKFTRQRLQAGLQRGASGSTGMQSVKMSTAVIVTQVALSGALLPFAMSLTLQLNWSAPAIGIRMDEYLSVAYRSEDPNAPAAQVEATYQRLKERLLSAGFAGVTFADQLPGSTHVGRLVEMDAERTAAASAVHRVRVANVDVRFFDTLGAPILAGRGFRTDDLQRRDVAIVNQPFVQEVLGGQNAVGRRVRYTGSERKEAAGGWYEVVGVVADLGMSPVEKEESKGMYLPAAAGDMRSGSLAIHTGPDPASATSRVRAIAAAADSTLLLDTMRPLGEIGDAERRGYRLLLFGTIGAIGFVVLLSAAVTFGLMSFTVSQRTREIGIRKALGANARTLLGTVFSRAAMQLGLGAGLGAAASFWMISRITDSYAGKPAMIGAVMTLMFAIGLLSCAAPMLRVLRIEPTEAMRVDM